MLSCTDVLTARLSSDEPNPVFKSRLDDRQPVHAHILSHSRVSIMIAPSHDLCNTESAIDGSIEYTKIGSLITTGSGKASLNWHGEHVPIS